MTTPYQSAYTGSQVDAAIAEVQAKKSTADVSTIVYRDAAGRFQAVSPSANADVAIKSYVDGKIAGTENYVVKFGAGGTVLGNSTITDDGTTITMLPAGNVGIGGTPTQNLSVIAAACIVDITSSTGTNYTGLELKNTGGSFYVGQDNSTGTFYSTGAYAGTLYTSGAYPIVFSTAATKRWTVSASASTLTSNGAGTIASTSTLTLAPASGSDLNANVTSGKLLVTGTGVVTHGITSSNSDATLYYITNSDASKSFGFGIAGTVNLAGESIAAGSFYLRDESLSLTRFLVTSAGNVGIGTTNPLYKLQVGDATAQTLVSIQGNATADMTPGLQFIRSNYWTMSMPTTTSLTFSYNTASWSDANLIASGVLTMTSTGNVGIGRTAPITKFDVAGSITKTTVSENTVAFLSSNEAVAGNPFGATFTVGGAAALADRYFTIQTTDYNSANGGNLVLQQYGGNVGIGTTTPDIKLVVAAANANSFTAGTAARQGGFAISSSTGSNLYGMFFGVNNNGDGWIQNGRTDSATYYNLLLNANGGNVGIGTTNPIDKFEVAGGIHTSGAAANSKASAAFFDWYSTGARIQVRGPNDTTVGTFAITVMEGDAEGQLEQFAIQTDGDVILAPTTGNVGIGTAGPVNALEVYKDQNGVTQVTVSNPNVGTSNQSRFSATSDTLQLDVGVTAASTTHFGGFATPFIASTSGILLTAQSSGWNQLYLKSDGNVGIGTTSPHASSILDLTSTTLGFLPPRMTTTQRDAISTPAAGLVIYNTTTNKLNVYTTAWEAVTSA